jgi:hypothetical protein
MSAQNGDKSRFHRERKQKIARRTRTRQLLKGTTTRRKTMDIPAGERPGAVSA